MHAIQIISWTVKHQTPIVVEPITMFYLKTVDALLSCYPDTITEPELVLV